MEPINREVAESLASHFQAINSLVPLLPIFNEPDYKKAVGALNMLLDAGAADEEHPLADLVNAVGSLIEVYESANTQLIESTTTEEQLKTQKAPFPLRLDDEVRAAAEKLAAEEKRSLNYQINELVKIGLKSAVNGAGKEGLGDGRI